MKTALINFTISLVTLIVGVLILEFAVRILDLAPPASGNTTTPGLEAILQFDATRESTYRPDSAVQIVSPFSEFNVSYNTNSLGLRDREIAISNDASETRILVVGNSFVEGWGVEAEETFLRVAERHMNKQRPPEDQIRIINAGQSGYGAAQSYLNARVLTPITKPKEILFVLIGTMVHADAKFLINAARSNTGIATGLSVDALLNGGGGQESQDPKPSKLVSGLNQYSALSRFVTTRLANLRAINAITPGDPMKDLLAAYRPQEGTAAQVYGPTFQHIMALSNYATNNDLRFSLLHLPMPFQMSDIEWDLGRQAYKLDLPSSGQAEQTLVKEFCAAEKLSCLFADDALRANTAQTEDDPRLYYRNDFHLNAQGNQKLGVWLSNKLQ